jgi:cysteine desulfurase / selenocysteine lyase
MSVFPSDLRALFPAVRRRTYLNAAASSPLATSVALAIEAHLNDTVENGDVHFGEWLAFRESLRGKVAEFIGAQPAEIAFLGSTSAGFSAVASLWQQRSIRRVLTLEGEFPSTTIPFLQAGFSLEVVRPKPDGSTLIEQLAEALKPEVGAVAVSAVQFASGYRLDLEAVAKLCAERKVPWAVNAAQALGQVPIDVAKLGCDFLAAPSHKWMLGGFGAGIFFAKTGTLQGVKLPWSGWFSPPEALRWDAFAGAQKSRESARGFAARGVSVRAEASALEASMSWGALHGLGAGLDILSTIGVPAVLEHNVGLQFLLRAGLRSAGFAPNTPDDEAGLSGICVVPVEGDLSSAVRGLFKEGVVTSPRGGGVRISTHIFNDESDVENALAAFDKLGLKPKRK